MKSWNTAGWLAGLALVSFTVGCTEGPAKQQPSGKKAAEKSASSIQEEVKDGAKKVGEGVAKAYDQTKGAVKVGAEAVKEGVKEGVKKAGEAVKTGAEKTGEALEKAREKVKQIGK